MRKSKTYVDTECVHYSVARNDVGALVVYRSQRTDCVDIPF